MGGKGEEWGEEGLLLTQQDPLPFSEAPLAPQVSGTPSPLPPIILLSLEAGDTARGIR